jgi:hypothetical protein
MAATPTFIASRRSVSAAVTAANTNVDGTSGTRADIVTGATNGTLVESVQIKSIIAAASTVVADMVRLWKVNTGGTAFLVKEITIPAGAGAIGVANQEADSVVSLNLPLALNEKLQASCHLATNGYHVTANCGDY